MQNLFYVGIDVSKKTLDASLFVEGVGLKEFPHIVVDNNKEGFKEMFRWLRKQGCKDNRTSFLMEYTGFYSNAIREFFDKKRFKYRMENPLELKLRFGIEDGRTRTLEEVGKEFDVTRERIRQIEAKALRKLRHPSRSKKLKDFID